MVSRNEFRETDYNEPWPGRTPDHGYLLKTPLFDIIK